MPFRHLLQRIKALLPTNDDSAALIEQAFRNGSLVQPAQPMSDAELAAAMREFALQRDHDEAIAKLHARFQSVNRNDQS